MFSWKAIGILYLVLIIVAFFVTLAITELVSWMFGITEAWAKGIIFAILFSAGSGVSLEQK